MKLGEWPLPFLRMTCATCGTEQSLDRDILRVIHGDEADLLLLREELACDKGAAGCRLIYADALLVDAILEPDEEKVVKPSLLPEAREWRAKLAQGEAA